jgi:hypothetical protein
MPNHVLVTAAMSFEERPITEGLTRARNRSFEVLRTGIGTRAGKALEARLANSSRPKPSLVISSGLAGIELSGIELGSWVLGTEVRTSHTQPSMPTLHEPLETWLNSAGIRFTRAPYRSATEVVQVDHEEAIQRGAVDMESFSLAQVCAQAQIPFAILRLISDTPEAPLPKAIGAFVQVSTAPTFAGKLQGFLAGLRETAADPKGMARFVGESPRLSKKLTTGWEKLAKGAKGGPHLLV